MADPLTPPQLAAINESVLKLQQSARRTVPMFFVGIVATLVAAAVAVFYIVTLSSDLSDARRALRQSQSALAQARGNLAAVSNSLSNAQQDAASPAGAGTIENVISDVTRSQRSIEAASSSINAATDKLIPTSSGSTPLPPGQIIGSCRLIVGAVTYLTGNCRITLAPGGSFQIYSIDGTGSSASVIRQGPAASASWQSGPGQAPVDLGAVQRRGACWLNDGAQVCAWK